jgi:hypothetical protein
VRGSAPKNGKHRINAKKNASHLPVQGVVTIDQSPVFQAKIKDQ